MMPGNGKKRFCLLPTRDFSTMTVLDGPMSEENVMLNDTAASLGIEYRCNLRGGLVLKLS